jgi:hypothetical protein
MANRGDTSAKRPQPADGHPVLDRAGTNAEREELRPRHNAVLLLGKPGKRHL